MTYKFIKVLLLLTLCCAQAKLFGSDVLKCKPVDKTGIVHCENKKFYRLVDNYNTASSLKMQVNENTATQHKKQKSMNTSQTPYSNTSGSGASGLGQ